MPIEVSTISNNRKIVRDTMSDEEKVWYMLTHGESPPKRLINRARSFRDDDGMEHGVYMQWIYTDKPDEEIDVDKYPQTETSPRQAQRAKA